MTRTSSLGLLFTMRIHPFPYDRVLQRPRRSNDLIKSILLLCFIVLASLTANTLPHMQSVIDKAYTDNVFHHKVAANRPLRSNNCIQHAPLQLSSLQHVVTNATTLTQPSSCKGRLHRNWTSAHDIVSPLAKQMQAHQSNCSLPVSTYHFDNDFGLGSHLYLWSQGLCNAMEQGHRLQTVNPHWLWKDQTYCHDNDSSPLNCYFPKVEPCDSVVAASTINVSDPRSHKCVAVLASPQALLDVRAASFEYLFSSVADIVIHEAERQAGLLFPDGVVPQDLITVHMRWGDKFWEMDLASEDEYVEAVRQLLPHNDSSANVYLMTEDPKASSAFIKAAPTHWRIVVDRTVEELGDFRPAKGNRASWTTRNTKGRAGLMALGSLLLGLEAKSFVLTTKSNWSRLMNELRKIVIDRECGNCTRMIDLRPGSW